jgi:hypothetical protein
MSVLSDSLISRSAGVKPRSVYWLAAVLYCPTCRKSGNASSFSNVPRRNTEYDASPFRDNWLEGMRRMREHAVAR